MIISNESMNFKDPKESDDTQLFRQPVAVSDISIYICLINIRSKSKEQLTERRAGLSIADIVFEVAKWGRRGRAALQELKKRLLVK